MVLFVVKNNSRIPWWSKFLKKSSLSIQKKFSGQKKKVLILSSFRSQSLEIIASIFEQDRVVIILAKCALNFRVFIMAFKLFFVSIKGGLISGSFSLWLHSPKNVPNQYHELRMRSISCIMRFTKYIFFSYRRVNGGIYVTQLST